MTRRDADFVAFAEEQTPALFRRAVLLTGDVHRAEDLVQDTLTRLYTRWHRVDPGQNPAGYAQTALFHRFVSLSRRFAQRERPTAELIDVSVDSEASSVDDRVDVLAALRSLSASERAVVVARYLDDRSVADAAALLGRTESWVKTTSRRALTKLRERGELVVDDDPTPPASDTDAASTTTPGERHAFAH